MGRMGRMGRMGEYDDPAHAGGPSSTLLNDALTTTRDGTVGYWDGAARYTPAFPFSDSPDDILYLQYDIRGRLLDHALHASMAVAGTPARRDAGGVTLGSAEVKGSGRPVVTIHQPAQDHFRAQLSHLRAYADLRDDRLAEINLQLGDIMSFFGAVGYLDPQRRARTTDLLDAVERLTVFVEMQVKHLCRSPRPIDYAPQVQPLIQTPDHSAFPSGHSTESFAVATVLYRLMEGECAHHGVGAQAHVFRVAERMAVNRTVAGVHFPCDSAAGAVLGCAIGEHVHALATGRVLKPMAMDFRAGDGGGFADTEDFSLDWLGDALVPPEFDHRPADGDAATRNAILAKAWELAAAEWP
ncbi:phosphatase PAP2 family protein [Psychromarinibacter sp. C21-152]|uniref:Phosphatase PAP2 family protein n=1 Tax=Psychromarinibacter sediminicola TaxID=3033385 RepID=A0AAE3T6H4_9RHOB|nr:phosphatase PAP2 family protein [Psychromarinibacter sediminicola]MDF0599257.1 phosphatase PAP2 family protein [Psychromarinibacter sediminicola]